VRAAYDDARARAERLADLAGAGLGPVVSLVEDDGHGGGMFLAAATRGKADLSIEPGETSVSASVTVSWQLDV
jgi:uncharacterized protein YggE